MSEDDRCPHLSDDGVCAVAKALAGGKDVKPQEDACRACTNCFAPRQRNYVTASIAVGVLAGDEQKATVRRFSSLDLFNVGRREIVVDPNSMCWPGCQLGRLIKDLAGVGQAEDCGCGSLAAEMDTQGIAWCRENVDWIVGKLIENLNEWIAHEDAQPPEGEEDEPTAERDKLPWWIKYGHRVPGASKMAGRIIVIRAIDRAEAALNERASTTDSIDGSLSG